LACEGGLSSWLGGLLFVDWVMLEVVLGGLSRLMISSCSSLKCVTEVVTGEEGKFVDSWELDTERELW
jgi:hypothetical protein